MCLVFLLKAPWLKALFLSTGLVIAVMACSSFTDYFRLRRQETAITWSQILILLFIGLWIAGIVWIFDIRMNEKNTIILGIIGGVMAWIFQDKVKGAMAFIHLRFHHLLSIDDWIIVPKYNIDGEVKRVSLTSVTVYNWDTTSSTFPISALQSEQFTNLQKMSLGKTYGRQMIKSFLFDTQWFHTLDAEEAEQLRQNEALSRFLPVEDIREGVLNAQLFRLYLFHWLMNQPLVSQKPRLVVRWLEQKESGLPLELYLYIMEPSMTPFEWQQSQIIEHVLESIGWFGLRLYQSPSGYDLNEALHQLTNNESRKETKP